MRRDLARHPEDFVSLSVSETSVHSSLQVFSVQLAYPVSPFFDREQFVCPRVHEIGEGNSGDGGGKIESRCTSGTQIESWVDKITSIGQSIQSVVNTANEATSIRHLSFADENITHEEPEHEELPEDVAAPEGQPARKRVIFEKTAGARATRSQNPTIRTTWPISSPSP
jgi:hypothetical protein